MITAPKLKKIRQVRSLISFIPILPTFLSCEEVCMRKRSASTYIAFVLRLLHASLNQGTPKSIAQVVPETVGALLDQMVVLRLQRMKPLPARVAKAALREYAQPGQRAQLAALARRVAAFAEGMRAMEKCAHSPTSPSLEHMPAHYAQK